MLIMKQVKLLLANGAASGISATFQKNDVTCLHIAAKNGSKEMVELLIQNRCNPNILSKTRKLASDEASTDEVSILLNRYPYSQIRQLIENYRASWKSEKKKSIDEKKRQVPVVFENHMQRSTIRQRGDEESSDDDSNKIRPLVQVEKKVEEADASSLAPNAKRVKETPVEKTVPKKLDLKRLAFMLDDDDDQACLFDFRKMHQNSLYSRFCR